ncbi:MAG: DUF6377 domain-containing protein [Candidatus Limisoma sp.]
MTRRIILILFAYVACVASVCADDSMLEQLDRCLANRQIYADKKEHRLDSIRKAIYKTAVDAERLKLYEQMYQEYYTYRYDSAMTYIQRGLALARQVGDKRSENLFAIHKSLLYATSGLYSEAEQNLLEVSKQDLDSELLCELYTTLYWTYLYRADYSSGSEFADFYVEKKKQALAEAIRHCEKSTTYYKYLLAEYEYLITDNGNKAREYYLEVIDSVTVDTRLYASATYCVARYYRENGDAQNYLKWLILSAISDVQCPLKENFAMQELAMYLFENNPEEIDRAMRYINCSMDDAQFYNNRLRIIEISKKMPSIVQAYEQKMDRQHLHIFIALVALALLSVGIMLLLFDIKRKNTILHRQKKELNEQHEAVKTKNEQLQEMNSRLLNTNRIRENYLRLFMDLCAIYIEKIDSYKTLVKRKIKANQTSDLVKIIGSLKLSEEDAAAFFRRFDKAFMELYPDFVDEFNTLLRPDEKISLNIDGSLPTELRIYALVRLGIKESSEIAKLLFYSPQTIYNYRTTVKNKAIRKDTFDNDVQRLSTVVRQ